MGILLSVMAAAISILSARYPLNLQVEVAGNYGILVVTKGDSAAKTSVVVDIAKIEKIICPSHADIIGDKRLPDKIIHHTVVMHALHHCIQPGVENAVMNGDTIQRW